MKKRLLSIFLVALMILGNMTLFSNAVSIESEPESQITLMSEYERLYSPNVQTTVEETVGENGETLYTVTPALLQNGAVYSSNEPILEEGKPIYPNRYLVDGSGTTNKDKAYNAIHDAFLALADSVNVLEYQLTSEDIYGIFQNLMDQTPELFYISSYSYSTSGSYVSKILPIYEGTPSEIEAKKATYAAELKKITDLIDPSWSTVEKVIFVSDYLSMNYTYDYLGIANGNAIYDAYNFLTQKTGVCQAYTLTTESILAHFGIKVATASSESMYHIWNLVEIDGSWYHLDVTWNDGFNNPVLDSSKNYVSRGYYGKVSHEYTLVSDAEFLNRKHYGWVDDHECTSAKYDNYLWVDISYPIVEADGNWFARIDDTVSKVDLDANTTQTELNIPGVWYVWGSSSSYWQNVYSGLGSYNDKLYYNGPTKVYEYNPKTKSSSEVTLTDYDSDDGYIYSSQVTGNVLGYAVATAPNDPAQIIYTQEITAAQPVLIDTVDVTYTAPAAGEQWVMPTVDLDADQAFVIISLKIWNEEISDWEPIDIDSPYTYLAGEKYHIHIGIVPKDGYALAENVTTTVNGSVNTENVFSTGDGNMMLDFDFELPAAASSSVIGKFNVLNSTADDMSVTLVSNGTVAYTAELEQLSSSSTISEFGFEFKDVEAGTYSFVIEKTAHLKYDITNIAIEAGTTLDLSDYIDNINLAVGDIDGDGYIDGGDITLFVYDMGKPDASATYSSTDLNDDGYRDASDITLLSYYLFSAKITVDFSTLN